MRRRVASMDTETLERLSKEYPKTSKSGWLIAEELARRTEESEDSAPIEEPETKGTPLASIPVAEPPATPPADPQLHLKDQPAHAVNDEPLILSSERFGVRLGESIDTVESKCSSANIELQKGLWSYEDEDHPGVIWSFQGALNGNDAVKMTRLSTFRDRIYEVKILFKDSSLPNYHVLIASLEKKYGKNEAGFFDSIETKGTFVTTDRGQKVEVVLNHDMGIMEDDTLALSYTHCRLQDQVIEEVRRRKASKVVDDL